MTGPIKILTVYLHHETYITQVEESSAKLVAQGYTLFSTEAYPQQDKLVLIFVQAPKVERGSGYP